MTAVAADDRPCPDEQRLLEFARGELPSSELPFLERHVDGCSSCFSLLAARASVAGTPSHVAPPDGAPWQRYQIEALLGKGASGEVFRAFDSTVGSTVAIKVLRRELAGDPAWWQRLASELKVARQIHSPNVCRVFTLERATPRPFLVMELGSRSLRAELDQGAVGDPLPAARSICAGLAALHQVGIIHRDLKPENVLRMPDGRLAISDLGLATGADRSVQTRFVGTPSYMAPEVLQGERADTRSDVWSLGMVLREIVRGQQSSGHQPPSSPPAPGGWRRAIQLRALDRLSRRCLAPRPEARPSDATRVLRAFDATVGAGAIRASMATIARPLTIAVAVLLGAFMALNAARGRRERLGGPSRPTSAGPAFVTGAPDLWSECRCPFSACVEGRCVSSCRASEFLVGKPLPGVSVPSQQEALLGASATGDVVLYLTGRRCALDRLKLARRQGELFVPVDLTDDPDLASISLDETCCTLSGDGRSLIVRATDRRRLLEAPLVGNDVGAPVAAAFAALGRGLPSGVTIRHPVLSRDGRTLYFMAVLDGAFHGLFHASRTDGAVPFAPATRVPGEALRYEQVSGISDDQLTIFMAFNFETVVLSRPTIQDRFATPRPAAGPPRLLGWRAIPVQSCQRIYTTVTPGGCESEDIVSLEAATR